MEWTVFSWLDSGKYEQHLTSLLKTEFHPYRVTPTIIPYLSPLTPNVLLVNFVPIDYFLTI